MTLPDKDIISGLIRKDILVLDYIYKRFYPMSKFIVFANCGNKQDAEDLFQETIYTLLKKVNSPGFELKVKFSTFIYSILKNLWLVEIERKNIAGRYSQKYKPDYEGQDFSENIDKELYSSILWNCYRKLGGRCKEILRLFWEEMPQKEIADILGITYGYYRKKKSECYDKLCKIILEESEFSKIIEERKLEISNY